MRAVLLAHQPGVELHLSIFVKMFKISSFEGVVTHCVDTLMLQVPPPLADRQCRPPPGSRKLYSLVPRPLSKYGFAWKSESTILPGFEGVAAL